MLQYTQDYDEKLPPMNPATSFKQMQQGAKRPFAVRADTPVQVRLYPYTRNLGIFRHPLTLDIYRPNRSLSSRSITTITRPAEVVMFYEGRVGEDRMRNVLYMDGHVARIRESDWARIAKRSGIALRRRATGHIPARAAPVGRGSPGRRILRSRRP